MWSRMCVGLHCGHAGGKCRMVEPYEGPRRSVAQQRAHELESGGKRIAVATRELVLDQSDHRGLPDRQPRDVAFGCDLNLFANPGSTGMRSTPDQRVRRWIDHPRTV